VSGVFIDDELAKRESDLLFRAEIAGREGYIYVLFEHQSAVDPKMPLRLLRYMIRIWTGFERAHPSAKLPLILPVVLHQGVPWRAATRLSGLIDVDDDLLAECAPFIPDFEFALEDLSRLDDEALHQRSLTALVRLAYLVMQRCRDAEDPLSVLVPFVKTIEEVLMTSSGLGAIVR